MKQGLLLVILLLVLGIADAKYYPPVLADQGMVVSDQLLASKVGAEILQRGGNAMDAAVATGYALAVVDPCCGNIGGGGFMLVHWHDGQNIVLDFRETAPAAIKADLFYEASGKKKPKSKLGYLLVGVPGTVLGFETALKRFGTMTMPQLMAPAIRLAQQGFILNRFDIDKLKNIRRAISKQTNIKDIFSRQGRPLQPGDRLQQKQLAVTLKEISRYGSKAFYQGDITKRVVAAAKQHHGVLSAQDFKNYRPIWRQPLLCQYRGKTVITAPPPSSGVTICEILAIAQGFPLASDGFHSAAATRVNIEAMNQAFYDRNTYLGDPKFVADKSAWLLDPARIEKIQANIRSGRSVAQEAPQSTPSHLHTTHYVVIDKDRNVISTTYTINSLFGAKVIAGNTGFFLNNELGDFALKAGHSNMFNLKQGKANLIAPGKRPLSSMSPTILMRDQQVVMSLGAAGGPTIITSIAETIENVLDYGMNIRAAIDSPRYHTQWQPNEVYMEPFTFSADTLNLLQKMHFTLRYKLFGKYTYWGQVAGIELDDNQDITGANDNRHPGGRAVGVNTKTHHYKMDAMF